MQRCIWTCVCVGCTVCIHPDVSSSTFTFCRKWFQHLCNLTVKTSERPYKTSRIKRQHLKLHKPYANWILLVFKLVLNQCELHRVHISLTRLPSSVQVCEVPHGHLCWGWLAAAHFRSTPPDVSRRSAPLRIRHETLRFLKDGSSRAGSQVQEQRRPSGQLSEYNTVLRLPVTAGGTALEVRRLEDFRSRRLISSADLHRWLSATARQRKTQLNNAIKEKRKPFNYVA